MDAREPRRGLLLGASATLAGAVLLSALAGAAGAAERVALVIGNGKYDHVSRLANPVNDAWAVGDAFERLGYEVTRLKNADYAALRKGLQSFKQAARGKEVAVVFYAGHGIGVGGSNFLVPVDAELGFADSVEDEAIPLWRPLRFPRLYAAASLKGDPLDPGRVAHQGVFRGFMPRPH